MTEATRIMGINGQPIENPALAQKEKEFKLDNTRFEAIAKDLKPIMDLLQKRKFNEAVDSLRRGMITNDFRDELLTYLLVSNLELATTIQKLASNADINAGRNSAALKGIVAEIELHEKRLTNLDGGALRN